MDLLKREIERIYVTNVCGESYDSHVCNVAEITEDEDYIYIMYINNGELNIPKSMELIYDEVEDEYIFTSKNQAISIIIIK